MYEVISHYGFECIFMMIREFECLSYLLVVYMLSLENMYIVILLIFNWVSCVPYTDFSVINRLCIP